MRDESPCSLVARCQFPTFVPPGRFLVGRTLRYLTQASDSHAIDANNLGRELRSGRLIHKWHEFVGETRHGTADADAANIRATANASHPAALRYITLHDRPPAPQLHQAFR